MTSKEYRLALHDQRWVDKRMIILERDDHTCTKCGATKELNVHHLKYQGMPWEVPDSWLITVCKKCHKKIHGIGVNKNHKKPRKKRSSKAKIKADI